MGTRLNERQWLEVLSARHQQAQQMRTAPQREAWQRAWNAVPKETWLMARVMGKSPREAYADWSAERVLASIGGAS